MNKLLLFVPIAAIAFASSCGPDGESNSSSADTMSAKDSFKKDVTENLPPSSDITQFEWIYSSFVAAATTTPAAFDVFINKETGLWIIHSNGAVPEMTNVTSIANFKMNSGYNLVPMDHDKMICTPKEDPLPTIECDSKNYWSKSGCFTSQNNTFKTERIWDYAGLPDADSKKVEELAGKITRVVINTELSMRMYFTDVNGTWYLTFLNIMEPCSA